MVIPGNLLFITSLGKLISLFRTPGIFNAKDFPFFNIPWPTTRKEFAVSIQQKVLFSYDFDVALQVISQINDAH